MGAPRFSIKWVRGYKPSVSKNRVWSKRQMNRLWRRLAKRDLDDAPVKRPTKFHY